MSTLKGPNDATTAKVCNEEQKFARTSKSLALKSSPDRANFCVELYSKDCKSLKVFAKVCIFSQHCIPHIIYSLFALTIQYFTRVFSTQLFFLDSFCGPNSFLSKTESQKAVSLQRQKQRYFKGTLFRSTQFRNFFAMVRKVRAKQSTCENKYHRLRK